ncbi:TPA: helix-turn-helix domain-containing protein [Legionella pneumophila]
MNIKERIGQRIYTERTAKGLSRKALADLTDDLKQSRINNWERGDRTPGPAEIQQLAKALDVSPAYLMCLTDDKDADKPKKIPGLGALIPVLDNVQASAPKASIDLLRQQQDEINPDFIPIGSQLAALISDYAFAFVVKDDSMSPELLEGDILIVDIDLTPKPGCYVLAKIGGENSVLVRQYKQLSHNGLMNQFKLLPKNSNWAEIEIDNAASGEIIGSVKGVLRYF